MNPLKKIKSKKTAANAQEQGVELLEGLLQPIIRTQNGGIIVYANSASDVILKSWKTKVGQKVPDQLIKKIEKAKSNRTLHRFEIAIKQRIFSIQLKRNKDEGWDIYGLDVTKERQVEKMKSEFISIASHQLKTPITGLKWHSEILLKQADPKNDIGVESLSMIHEAAKRLDKLIDNLLNVSRIESKGQIPIKKGEVVVADYLKKVSKEAQSFYKERNPLIRLNIKHQKGLAFKIDQQKMSNALQSLIENAVIYSKKRPHIEIESILDKTGHIVISLKDKGIGITKEDQKKVGKKFFRANEAILMKPDGTGVGIFLARAIVESHGGRIRFESKKDEGSTFFIKLKTAN